jgi:hypothetical protein
MRAPEHDRFTFSTGSIWMGPAIAAGMLPPVKEQPIVVRTVPSRL